MQVILDYEYNEHVSGNKYKKCWLNIKVFGHYESGADDTDDTQGTASTFEISKVIFNEVDITNLLEVMNVDFTEIETKCIEQIEN